MREDADWPEYLSFRSEFREALKNLATRTDTVPRAEVALVRALAERAIWSLDPRARACGVESAFEGLDTLSRAEPMPSPPYLEEAHLLAAWNAQIHAQQRRAQDHVLDVDDEDHGKLLWNGKPMRYFVGESDVRAVSESNAEGQLLLSLIVKGEPPVDLTGTRLSKALNYLRSALGRDAISGRGRQLRLALEFRLSPRLEQRQGRFRTGLAR